MKRLTIGRIASAGIKADRKGYRSMAVGIFLSIFIITVICLAVQGGHLARKEQKARKLGYEDCFLLNGDTTDEAILATGLFDRMGHIYVTGREEECGQYLGYYDVEGQALMNRRLLQGRMPEQPGELAVERGVLALLNLEIEPGEQITLSILPIDGVSEQRTFTLVGILAEQGIDVTSNVGTSEGTVALPSLLTCQQEPDFATGRAVTHRPLTLSRGTMLAQVFDYERTHGYQSWGSLIGVSEEGPVFGASFQWEIGSFFLNETMVLVVLMGISLLLATGIGIASAMDGQLSRRTEEIGMLRAVGATRRQIRRIFGREAWLLALLLSPLSVAGGCVCVWLLSRQLPDQMIFRPSLFLLIPILLLSMACVLLSARLPLRRAANRMPMGVLRDTALLRRGRHIHGKSSFRVPALMASRQRRLYPTRQIGSAALVAVMLLCSSFVTTLVRTNVENASDGEIQGFSLYESGIVSGYLMFGDIYSKYTLSEQDLAQIAALEGVKRVSVVRNMAINLVTEQVPSYFRNEKLMDRAYLYDEYLIPTDEWQVYDGLRHDAVRDVLGIGREKSIIAYELVICEIDPEKVAPYVAQGTIDLKAINEGRAVLSYQPDIYIMDTRDGGKLSSFERPKDTEDFDFIENDAFTAGETISLMHLYEVRADDVLSGRFHADDSYDQYCEEYRQLQRQDAQAVVGAVLKGNVYSGLPCYTSCLVTTPQGAAAMGLRTGHLRGVDVYMEDNLGEEQEEWITSRIETIALRGDKVQVYNRLQQAKENDEIYRRFLWTIGTVTILFFVVAIAMVTGNVTRRLQADRRIIGTLRAVGADERTILQCYRRQVIDGVVTGALLAALILAGLLIFVVYDKLEFLVYGSVGYGTMFILCLLACCAILRVRVRRIISGPVVESIREL